MKEWAELITKYLSNFVEILAAVVIAIALLQFIVRYASNIFKPNVKRPTRTSASNLAVR